MVPRNQEPFFLSIFYLILSYYYHIIFIYLEVTDTENRTNSRPVDEVLVGVLDSWLEGS
jgi:hypothetical protein